MTGPYQPLDLFFTRKPSSWLSRAILWATQEDGEEKSEASHVGAILTSGTLDQVVAIEALRKVRIHRLWNHYAGSGNHMTVYRPLNIGTIQRDRILERLRQREGQTYGYTKILWHLLRKLSGDPDWLKMSLVDRWPICSYLIAVEFEREGLSFGVEGRRATPDDQHDFVRDNPDKYQLIRPWARV